MGEVPGSEDWQQFLKLLSGCLHTSDGSELAATGCGQHVAKIAETGYHLKLVWPDYNFLLWSTVDGACRSQTACTPEVWVWCEALQVAALLMGPVLATLTEYAVGSKTCATDSTSEPS